MTSPEDLEGRLSAVERDVARLREQLAASTADSSAARILAADADRDVSEVRAELRAHTSALSALRQSQLDLERTVDAGFARVEEQFARVGAGLAQIVTLIEGLDRR